MKDEGQKMKDEEGGRKGRLLWSSISCHNAFLADKEAFKHQVQFWFVLAFCLYSKLLQSSITTAAYIFKELSLTTTHSCAAGLTFLQKWMRTRVHHDIRWRQILNLWDALWMWNDKYYCYQLQIFSDMVTIGWLV